MMTIIVLWILLGIVAFIVIVLHFSLSAYVKFDSNGFDFNVKYLFFTLYPRAKKTKKPKEQKNKKVRRNKVEKSEQEDLFHDDLQDDFQDRKSVV